MAALALLMLVSSPGAGFAHDNLAAQIAGVTAQIRADGANAQLYARRAELRRASRQWAEATADLERAATLDPSLLVVDLIRARLALDMGRPLAAMTAATALLERQPRHVEARLIRARAGARLGRADDAAADYTAVLDQQAVPDLYVERARTISSEGRARWAAAVQGLDEGIGRLGPLVTLETEAIGLEVRLGRYDAALQRVTTMAASSNRKEPWLARRGSILERAGRRDEAVVAYQDALMALAAQPSWTQRTPASVALADRLRTSLTRLRVVTTSTVITRQH